MPNVLLDTKLTKDNQSFELFVEYDPEANEVTRISSIWLLTHGKRWPVDELMIAFFEDAVNKIIDETDWRKIYCESIEYDGIKLTGMQKALQQVLAPFITH
jgi:hypothetical protein